MEMRIVYVYGIPGCGLGNVLFQISSAIYYCEKYSYGLELLSTDEVLYGTSNKHGKVKCIVDENNNFLSYDKTIFKNIKFCKYIPANCINLTNEYTSTIIIPTGYPILLHGYCQNINLFKDHLTKMSKYLHLDDSHIKEYIFNKYGNITNEICLGIRIGSDFSHMKKITLNSYLKALEYYKHIGVNTNTVYIISDTPNNMLELEKHYNCIEVNEPDIIQFYFGMMCKNYILSESTFHLWMAYLGTCNDETKKVICFNDTDITNRSLNLKSWITINY